MLLRQEHLGETKPMGVDDMAPCLTKSSAGMVFTIHSKQVCVLHKEEILLCTISVLRIDMNCRYMSSFLKTTYTIRISCPELCCNQFEVCTVSCWHCALTWNWYKMEIHFSCLLKDTYLPHKDWLSCIYDTINLKCIEWAADTIHSPEKDTKT